MNTNNKRLLFGNYTIHALIHTVHTRIQTVHALFLTVHARKILWYQNFFYFCITFYFNYNNL